LSRNFSSKKSDQAITEKINTMFTQSIQMLLRRLAKDGVFSFINLTNLIVGFATFILLSQFIQGMLSFDKHNEHYERVYRLQLYMDQKGNSLKHTWSVTAALGRHDLAGLPEIDKIALLHDVGDNNKSGVFLSVDKKNQFLTRFGYYADQTVFEIFTFNFLEGDPGQALIQPFSIVLSKTLADKLFPLGKSLGQQVYGENKAIFTVTGVYEDIPAKSWWHPAYLIPMLSFTALTGNTNYEENYWSYSFYTYVLLKPNTNPASVDQKIHDALKDYRKEHYPYLRPLSMVYLKPYFQNDLVIMIALFSFIAVLLLLLSSINYINLQTANAITRFREIGIKKALGFTKKRLWAQFMFESITLACIGGILGLILAQLALPVFNRMLGEEFLTSILTDWKMIIGILLVTLLTGFLSGIHPAYAISAFNPVVALKQKFVQEESNGISLKKILVTAQFFISLFLLIISAIIFRQTQYMLNKEMGFESRKLLFANIITTKSGSFDALRQSLLRHPEIEDACQSDYIPFILPGGNDMNWEGEEPEEKVFVRWSNISYEFISTYNLKITGGRNFSREYPSDHQKCLINETAVKVFGWDNAIGKHIRVNENDIEVIGVIRDYVAFSVHNPIEPHMYRLLPDSIQSDHVYSVRFTSGNERKAKQIVQEEFEEFFPNDAFEFRNIQGLVQNENAVKEWTKIMKVCSSFAVVSIIISSIGLFGLILFYTRRKMKEIGMRKVLGFSSVNLLYTMSSGFIRLLLASIVLAWPAAYYVYKVLPGADKYPIQIWEFLLATLVVFFVAQVTMSYQIIKAIRTKAVDVLKDE
jgi:putative ABC transport system permease protein